MNETLLNYIVQAILGGASGYITNDYAINMLFKEYTPLKLGGVIKKTRNEFVENLSSMVENDIINKEKLHEIFNSQDFREKFEKLTDDFYEVCLYERVGSDTFSDIDGFNSTLKESHNYINNLINEHIESIINLLANNFDISYLLTNLQSEKIANSLCNSAKNTLENTKFVENALVKFYENNKGLIFTEILGSNIELINKPIDKFVEIIVDNVSSARLVDEFDFAVNEALDVFFDRQIKDIINVNEAIDSLLSSLPNIEYTSYKGIQSVFSYGKTLDKSLYSLLNPAFEKTLKTYMEENLPFVTDQLVSYVQKNGMLIDRIIEDSIDEVLEESEGLRAKLLFTIKNTYLNNLSKKYSIVDKIITFIKQSTEAEKLSINISKKLVEKLDTTTLRDMVIEAENNNFNADKAYALVASFISKNGSSIRNSIESYISKLHVRDVLPPFNISAKELLESNVVMDFLKNKSESYVKTLLSKELSCLIGEDDLDSYADKLNSFLKLKFNEHEKYIENFISDKINTVNVDKEILKDKKITDFIKKEAYDKYKEEAGTLEDIELSLVLDKLNSIENISNNSSETLRKYMVKNTDTILKGSIKNIVSNNLNKLSDDELVTFANEFIGRELKPIMFFGGILGVIAGLILAAFQNSPFDLGQINIANMATYAFVGFITNVIAINMIFKPYREIKFLSKIPFLRNFSLGYIIKNQKNFARTTANYIDTSLLSKKSINELFEKHKNNIKHSFIKSIGENDYATLSNLLVKNKEGTISGTWGFLKKNISKHIRVFSSYLYDKISQTKLSALLTDRSITTISNFACESLQNTKNLSSKIYSHISSEEKLNTIMSVDYFTVLLNNQGIKLYDKSLRTLAPEHLLEEIGKHNERYVNYSNKNIGEALNLNDENLTSLSSKINEIIFSENFTDKITWAILNLFNKAFDRNKTFEELFDGQVKSYIDTHLPRLLEYMTDKVKNKLAENKGNISINLRSEFKNNLGLIERGMFDLMGGDELVDDIINKLITDKLPKYMDAKKDEINKLVVSIINERFYKTKVEVLYTSLNKLQINNVIENYINTNNEKISNKINAIVAELYDNTKGKEIKSILKIFYMDDLKTLLNSYEPEISRFAQVIHSNLTSNKGEMIEELSSINSSTIEQLFNLKFSDIFHGLVEDDINQVIKNTRRILDENETIKKILELFIVTFKDYHNNVSLDYYIDKNEFIISTEKFINSLLEKEGTEKIVKEILHSIIDQATDSNFSFIDSKSKEYLVNIFIDSSIESLRRNLDEILKSVEFDRIAAEEIEKMEPEKIHLMFDSFAGKYFKKLMLYGFGGIAFGINMYVGFTLTGIKIISELFNKDR